jgi:hypothetical protein
MEGGTALKKRLGEMEAGTDGHSRAMSVIFLAKKKNKENARKQSQPRYK